MADKKDNGNVSSGLFSNTVIEPFSPRDRDTIPNNILQFENLISGFSAVLIDAPAEELENELNNWLKKFVDFLKVDRSIVCEYLDDRKTIRILIDYTVPEVDAAPFAHDHQPLEGVIKELEKGIIIRAEKVPDDLPEILHGGIIHSVNTKSIVVVPLSIGSKVIGNLSFANYRKERKWPDDLVRRIKLVGEIIANAILRIRSHETLLNEMERRQMLEERYTSIIETANVGFWLADRDQNILVVNDEYCRMSGYSREEVLAKKVWELDVTGDPDKVQKDVDVLFNNGSTHLVATHIRKDGSLFDIEVSSTIFEKEGYICSFIRDITDLNQARKELEARLGFEELISNFSATLVNIDLDDIEAELNNWLKKFVEFLKVDRCSVIEYSDGRKTIHMLMNYTVPEVDSVPVVSDYQPPEGVIEELEKGTIIRAEKIPDDLPQTFRGSIIEKDKTKSTVIVPLSIGNRVIGSLTFASYRKERKWSDDLVRRIKLIGEIIANAVLRIRSHETLIEEKERRQMLEERYSSVIRTANVGFMISDLNARILDVNETYCEMSGYSREELLGMTIYQLDASHDPDKIVKEKDQFLETGSYHREHSHVRKDGTIIDVLISSNMLEREGYICGFIRDITELNQTRKEREERLKFEEFISEFSAALININPDDIKNELENWLEEFVYLLDVDRFIVHEYVNDQKNVQILMHYTVPEVNIPIENMRQTPEGVIEELEKGVLRAEKVPEDLPQVFQGTHVEKHNTKSFVVVPLLTGNRIFGNLSFSSYRKERQWPDDLVRRIKLIGEIIANAILRLRSHQSLLEETERRQNLEERYASIIKTANVGFWIADQEQNILVVNDEYCRMSGYSREELTSKKVWEMNADRNPDKERREREGLYKNGLTHLVTSQVRKDGRIFDIEVDSNVFEGEGYICSFIRDITDLNQARKELEERLEFEELVSAFSAALINIQLDDISEELNHWIQRFVEFLKVDRCIINEYQDDKKTVKPLVSHTDPDVDIYPPEESLLIPDIIMNEFERGIVIRAEKIPEDLPPQFHGWMIEKHNTKSLVIVPLTGGNKIIGNLTFASYRKERKWSDDFVRRIKLIGEIIANAILQKRSSDALLAETKRRQRLEERYTSIVKTANVGFLIIDLSEHSIIDVNDEYCRMSGYSRDELISKKTWEIDASVDPNKVRKEGEFLVKEGSIHILTSHIRKDGSLFDVEVSSNLFVRDDIVYSFVRDVTDLNQARKELEERLIFEELISEFSAALVNVKLDDTRQEINRWLERFVKLLNVDRCTVSDYQDDFTKMNLLFSYTNPDVEVKLRPLHSKQMTTFGFHKYLIKGDIIKYESLDDTFPEDIEHGMLELKKDGTKSLLMLPMRAGDVLLGTMSISTLTSEKKWTQGQIRRLKLVAEIFANALMRDRTDFELENYRKDLENMVDERTARLKEAQQELVLSEKMATLGRLTATVSHELRNPLGTIRSSLFSVNKRLKGQDERTEKALERAERSVQRCDIIIEELLDYSRAQTLTLRRIDIDNWLTELLEDEKPPEDIILEKELNAGVFIEMDRERLRRCMINILTNAYQSIEEKSDNSNPGYVRVITKREESGIKIEISDNGPGFAQEDIGKIFEPLYSTKTFGVGLGIPITKQIVEMHGWGMDMKGEPGKGALVIISIPIT